MFEVFKYLCLAQVQSITYRLYKGNQMEIEAKQNYLRQHIPEDKYEDFGQYCQNKLGNVDIEAWSMAYIQDLVRQFYAFEAEKQKSNKNGKYQSFYAYQTGNEKELKELRQQIKKEETHEQKTNKLHEKVEQQKPSETKVCKDQIKTEQSKATPKTQKQQSAMELLDSIFDKSPSPNNFETKKYDKSFFESSNFWEVPSITESKSPQEKVFYNTNIRTQPNNNFQQVFSTGLNIDAIKQQKTPSPSIQKIEKNKVSGSPKKDTIEKKEKKKETSNTREWKLMQIPIDEENETVSKVETKKAREWKLNEISNDDSLQRGQQEESKKGKSTIKLKSVKNIKSQQSKIPYKGQSKISHPFKTRVACFKSFERINSSKDIKITIINHQIIQRSFFSSNYPMFHLKIEPTHIVCKRNFEDFEKLKKNLEAVYPGIRLPYLDKAGWLESQTSNDYIQKQKKYLEYFLEDILSHKELRNSRILEDFLTLKDHKAMKRKFEEYQKIKGVNSIEELCLLEGEVAIEISEQHRQYNEFSPKLIEKMGNFLTKQQAIMEAIEDQNHKLAENYGKWGQAIRQIKAEIQEFNKKVSFRELTSMEDSLESLYRYTCQCQNFNENEIKFIAADFSPFFRFEEKNMGLLGKVIDIQNLMQGAYLRRCSTDGQEEKIEYLSERLKDYKVNLLQQSKHFTVLKYQCGYLNEIAVQEVERYFQRVSAKVSRVVSDVCYAKLSKLSQSINICTELVVS